MDHNRLWSNEHMGFSSEGPDGIIVIRWPRKIDAGQLEYIEGLLSLALKCARRSVAVAPDPTAVPAPAADDGSGVVDFIFDLPADPTA